MSTGGSLTESAESSDSYRIQGEVTNYRLHFIDHNNLLGAVPIGHVTDIERLSRINLNTSVEKISIAIYETVEELTSYDKELDFSTYCIEHDKIIDHFLVHTREEFFLYEARTKVEEKTNEIIAKDLAAFKSMNKKLFNFRKVSKNKSEKRLDRSASGIKYGFLSEIEDKTFKEILEVLKKCDSIVVQEILSQVYIQCYLAREIPKRLSEICQKIPELKEEYFHNMTQVSLFLDRKVESLELAQGKAAFKEMVKLQNKTFFNDFKEYSDWMSSSAPKIFNDYELYVRGKEDVLFPSYIADQMTNIERSFKTEFKWDDYIIEKVKHGELDLGKIDRTAVIRQMLQRVQSVLVRFDELNSCFGKSGDTDLNARPIVNRIKDEDSRNSCAECNKRISETKSIDDSDEAIANTIIDMVNLDELTKRSARINGFLSRYGKNKLSGYRDLNIQKMLEMNVPDNKIQAFLRRRIKFDTIKKANDK